jgi:hypothetical protein
MSALLSFLGGSAFRAVWGEFSSWMNKRQEHRYEIERMQLQGKLDTDTHARNMESQRLQAELGIKTIEVKSEADQAILAAEAFRDAMKQAAVPTGIVWVDAWNASVRPAFASVVLFLWLRALQQQAWATNDWDRNLMAGICGFYFADRMLGKRGK